MDINKKFVDHLPEHDSKNKTKQKQILPQMISDTVVEFSGSSFHIKSLCQGGGKGRIQDRPSGMGAS